MSDVSARSISVMLQRARDKAPGEIEQLCAVCRNFLMYVARAEMESRLRAKFDVRGLLKQTALQAHRDFDKFAGATEGEWLVWLKEIVTRNAAQLLRQIQDTGNVDVVCEASTLLGENAALEVNPGHADAPLSSIIRRERDLQIADALAQLPGDYQDVILLRNLQRLPFQEVAERMGKTRAAAQTLWGRAIGRLQQTFLAMREPTVMNDE
jgi:RNA polymerase sigma-70 factor (ECF subfamily)